MRVLIVDDSRPMRTLLAHLVGELRVDCAQAEDGRAALAVLRQEPAFDAVLVDWDMPRMNGIELIRAVRSMASLSHLKLLMVTRHNSIDQVRMALDAGACDFLMKPFTKEMLENKLRMLGSLAAAVSSPSAPSHG